MVEMTVWDVLRHLLLATRWTVLLSLMAFAGGVALGLLLLPLRTSRSRALRTASRIYVDVFQGTPLLIQLFVVYFGLPLLGITLDAWSAATIGLTLWSSAYLTEIWRGCVNAIPKGQWDASASLGFTYLQQMRHVILPQALRIAIAPTVGFMVQIVKSTAITSIIGFVDVSRAGAMISNVTYQPFMVYSFVGLIYFCLCFPLSKGSRALERKLNVAH